MTKITFVDNLPPHIEELAQELELSLIRLNHPDSVEVGQLRYEHNKLIYRCEVGDIDFDWVSQWQYHRRQNYALSKEPLYKALGLKKGDETQVWDVTCGTGKDSLLMLSFGLKVMAFERHPVVAALIRDAHHRAVGEVPELTTNFSFHFGDARSIQTLIPPEVIYYDPMYPEKKKKSALPRKEMQIFQGLVGEDLDEEEFFAWAIETATKRVVVKRGLRAPDLAGKKPSVSYRGKSTRYDMYVIIGEGTNER